jgi:NhaP-type Na+/H+ or K+/H+ antiporter
VVGVQVGDDHRVDVDVVAEVAQLGEDAVAAVEEQAGAMLLDEVAAASASGILPGRRLAQHGDPHFSSIPPRRFFPLWDCTRMTSFETAATVLGALLVGGALLSGLARRSFLSLTAVFVVVGFLLGADGLDVLKIDPRSTFVHDLAITALVLILFRDGLEVDSEMLQRAWHLPLRKLVLAMPITAVIIALATKALVDLTWTEAFLVGALLSPTDPVLSSSVVNNPRVPRVIRHSLNLESGLNDGLALPAVLAFGAALVADSDFVWWKFLLQDVSLGVAYGMVIGYLASHVLPSGRDLEHAMPAHQRALYLLGVAFLTYGLTTLPPHGNGVIAVFVCAIVLGIRRPDVPEYLEMSTDIIEIVKLGVFVVFGSLLTLGGLFTDGWAAVGVVLVTLLVARTAAVWIALAGTGVDGAEKAFMAWFGPKGVATMTFSLLVLSQAIPQGERIFNLAALVVVCSVVAHGLTDTPGAEWIGRRAEQREREAAPPGAPARVA